MFAIAIVLDSCLLCFWGNLETKAYTSLQKLPQKGWLFFWQFSDFYPICFWTNEPAILSIGPSIIVMCPRLGATASVS